MGKHGVFGKVWTLNKWWALSSGRRRLEGGCKEKITEENLNTAKRAMASLCAADHKVSFCKSIYRTPGPHCLPASCYPLYLLLNGEMREKAACSWSQNNLHLSKTLFPIHPQILMGLLFFFKCFLWIQKKMICFFYIFLTLSYRTGDTLKASGSTSVNWERKERLATGLSISPDQRI